MGYTPTSNALQTGNFGSSGGYGGSGYTPSANPLQSRSFDPTYFKAPAPLQFKDTPQGQKFRSIFSQADQQTKAQIFNHLTNAAKAGNQRSYDQLNAIRDIVQKPAQNPVQMATSGNGLLDAVQNITRAGRDHILAPTIENVLGGGTAGETLNAQGKVTGGGHQETVKQVAFRGLADRLLIGAPGEKALGEVASKIPGVGKVASTAVQGGHQFGSFNAANSIENGDKPLDIVKHYGTGFRVGSSLGVAGAGLAAGLGKAAEQIRPVNNATKSQLLNSLTHQSGATEKVASHVTPLKNLDSILNTGIKPSAIGEQGGVKGVSLGHDYTTPSGGKGNWATAMATPGEDNVKINFKTSALKGGVANHGVESTYHGTLPVTPENVKSIEAPDAATAQKLAAKGFKTEVNPQLKAQTDLSNFHQDFTEGKNIPGEAKTPNVAQSPTLLKSEQGAVNPGQAIKDVQGLVAKHQASAPFSEDIAQSSRAVEGNKKIIQNDAAGVIKNRQALSAEDKATLQEYRDRQAAGLDTKPLPERLQKEHQATTALNLEAQKSDAELARLNGQESKARAIEARNPDTYTHRVAQGKGSAFDYLLQGDRKSPIQVSSLGKTKPGDKARVFHAVTDEQGNRKLVAIKNHTVKVEGKTVARGKLVTAIDENGKGTELGKMKLKSQEDLLKTETKPFQDKLKKLQSEYKALDNVKIKDQFPTARFNALAKKAALLEDTKNFTGLNKAEQKSLNAAVTKAKELMKIKPGGSNVPGRLAKLDEAMTHLSTTIDQITEHYNPAELNDRVFVGNDGQRYTVGQATTSEITRSTGQKYYVDPQLTALANYVESRSALENARFIDHIKTSPDFENFGVGPDATAPKGWKPVNSLMQFQGYRFEPRVAETLQSIAGSGMSEKNILDQTGRFLRQTIVYFPLKHDLNMAAAYVVDRGLTNAVNPFALKRMGSSLYQAIREVTSQGPLYQQALRAGFSMPSADTKAFEQAFNKELQKVVENKSVLDPIAKQILTTPKRLADAYSRFQHVSVWELQDILNLARVIERTQGGPLKKGLSFEDALKQTGRFNFQYQVPTRVAGSRQLSNLLTSDKVFFGRYRYDQWKILSNIVKDSVNLKNPSQAAQSWDKLAVLALGASVLWPMVDAGLQKATGSPNAKMTAPGPLGIPEQIINAATGKGNWRTAVTNQLYLSGALSLGIQIYDNRDSFTGKNISDPNASPADQAKQALAWIGTQMAPAQKFQQVKSAGGNTLLNAALSLSGVSFPKNNAASQKVSSLQFDSLPLVQAQAKALAVKGDKQGAQKAIDKYDQQVLAASKEAFKQAKKPTPPDDQLIKSLKQQHIWYAPKQKTIDGWTAPAPKGSLTDKLSTVKKSKK